MIALLFGTVGKLVDDDHVIISTTGVGYEVTIHQRDRDSFRRMAGAAAHVHVYSVWKEPPEGLVLFGFLEHEDKEMFKKLIDIDSVGPTTAMRLLGTWSWSELPARVHEPSNIRGIGAKTWAKLQAAFP